MHPTFVNLQDIDVALRELRSRPNFDVVASRSSIAQKAFHLQESYVGAVNAGSRSGGGAASIRAGLAAFDGLSSSDQQILFKAGINAPDRSGSSPYADVQGWRDNMSAQLKLAGYLRPDGVADPNLAAKKAQDPRFTQAVALVSAPNNTSAAWTQKVLQLFGGDAPKDRVELSDAAKAAMGSQSSPAAAATTAPYRTGSIVSTVA